jgi:DNA-binding MarR family transcriptional regulator
MSAQTVYVVMTTLLKQQKRFHMALNIDVFPIERSPGFIIHRMDTMLSSALHRAFQARNFEITAEQWGVLSRLWEGEGVYQSELAVRAGKDRHNMTRILQLLEKNGFIRRLPDPTDKRRLVVYLTNTGRRLQSRLTPIVLELLERVFDGFSQADIDRLEVLHNRIIDNVMALNGGEIKEGLHAA